MMNGDKRASRQALLQHPTAEAAILAYPAGKRCRTMEVTPTGRRPL